MGYLGQKYDKGLVIQRSPEGSAFQENVDVTVDGDTEITPKVGGGLKKVNITSSGGGGSTAKYVDLTDYFEDTDFPGQLVELDKEQLGIEDVTTDDILDRKVIFTVSDNYLLTLIDDCSNLSDLNYPWINMQLDDFQPLIAQVFAFENVTNIITQQAVSLVIAFTEDGKIYASGVQNVGSESQSYELGSFLLNNYQEGSLEGDINAREMGVSVNNTEEGASAEARVRCVARLNEETGEPESAVLLYGGQLFFNDQPIGGGGGSIYNLGDTPNLILTVHRKEEEQREDWPRQFTYRVTSNNAYQSNTPLSSGYSTLKQKIDAIISEEPAQISMGCVIKIYNDDESEWGSGFNNVNSMWTLTGRYDCQNGDNEETSLVYTTTIMLGLTVNLVIRKAITELEEPWNLQYWFMIQSPEIKMYGTPVESIVIPGE